MKIPTNSSAENIDRLTAQNEQHTFIIAHATKEMADNNLIIEALMPAATWEEIPDPVEATPNG